MIAHTDGHAVSRSRTNTSARQAAGGGNRLAGLIVMAAGVCLFGPGGPMGNRTAIADETSTSPPPASEVQPGVSQMAVAVRQLNGNSQKVVLSAGGSAVVELGSPMARAQVADPDVVEMTVLSPRQLLLTSKAVGNTQLVIWDAQNEQTTMSVLVQVDLAELEATLSQLSPGSSIRAHAIKDAILLTGTVPDSDTASRVMDIAQVFSPKIQNQLKVVGVHQVLLRCTVAEVNKRAIRQLGVNGWIAGDNVRDMFAVNQLDQINPVNIGGAPVGNIIQSGGIPFATDENGLVLQPTPQLSVGFPRVQMQLFFQALRENTLLRVLAEPNLVAMSGQEATFLAGGEFPVPIPQGIGDTITIEFKEFGVRLKFTPTVVGRQMIRLKVAPEVSEPDFTTAVQFAGFVIPGLTQRRAETTIELASGTTIAMAGLLSESVRASARSIPGLGDVPVLGSLFRSVNYQKSLTELVILVTPELVTGMQPDQVTPVPGQFMTDPNDWQLFGLGMVEGEPMPEAEDPDASLSTDISPKYRKFPSEPEQMSLHGLWGPAESVEALQ